MAHASFAALHSNGWTNFGICERGTRHKRSQPQSLDLPSSLALRSAHQFCPVVNIRKRLRHVRYSCWSRNNRRFQFVGAGKPGCLQSAGSSSIVGLWHVTYTAQGQLSCEAFDMWHSDGTEVESANVPPTEGNFCMGVWKPVGSSIQLNHVAGASITTATRSECSPLRRGTPLAATAIPIRYVRLQGLRSQQQSRPGNLG